MNCFKFVSEYFNYKMSVIYWNWVRQCIFFFRAIRNAQCASTYGLCLCAMWVQRKRLREWVSEWERGEGAIRGGGEERGTEVGRQLNIVAISRALNWPKLPNCYGWRMHWKPFPFPVSQRLLSKQKLTNLVKCILTTRIIYRWRDDDAYIRKGMIIVIIWSDVTRLYHPPKIMNSWNACVSLNSYVECCVHIVQFVPPFSMYSVRVCTSATIRHFTAHSSGNVVSCIRV